MILAPLFERFCAGTPLTVMTRALLENAFNPQSLDDLFERLAVSQYTRELHFSTLVHTMMLVACRVSKSPRAVFIEHPEWFPVTLKCFYEKLQGVELPLMREMVRSNAEKLQPLLHELGGETPPLLPGYRVKILDGNALAGTEHRIKPLRNVGSGALPGKSLVVLDPQLGLVLDVIPCEDGHAQERALIPAVLETVQPGDLWIEDRNFCTLGFLIGVTDRGGHVLVREHAGLPWGPPVVECTFAGRIDTGEVWESKVVVEQVVEVEENGRLLKKTKKLTLRRLELRLDEPTRDGVMTMALLTNAMDANALTLAKLYQARWKIETLFNLLTTTLNCEPGRLGYPKAALFAFCVTLLASNLLAAVKAALASVHGVEKVEKEVSLIKLTEHVMRKFDGMMVALPEPDWALFRELGVKEMADLLRKWAAKVDLRVVRKAATRKKQKKNPKPKAEPGKPHVSTARLLAAQKNKPGNASQ